MRERCSDPRVTGYAVYGGRGISVCDRWSSFPNFYADMGKRPSKKHSIERIDNELGYSPDNCQWATMLEQANNTRRSIRLAYDGQIHTLKEWSRILGLSYPALLNRVHRGWSTERILTQPVKQHVKSSSHWSALVLPSGRLFALFGPVLTAERQQFGAYCQAHSGRNDTRIHQLQRLRLLPFAYPTDVIQWRVWTKLNQFCIVLV
jgi:hypothetical protein